LLSYELLYNTYADNYQDGRIFLSPLRQSPPKRKYKHDDDNDDHNDEERIGEDDGEQYQSLKQAQKRAVAFSNGGTNELSDLSSVTGAGGSRVNQALLWYCFATFICWKKKKKYRRMVKNYNVSARNAVAKHHGSASTVICITAKTTKETEMKSDPANTSSNQCQTVDCH
jgi:hypothetical protein